MIRYKRLLSNFKDFCMKNEKWVLKQRPNGRPNIETDFEKTSEE